MLSRELEQWIAEAARQEGTPASLFRGLVLQESRGNADARSPAGAIGLAQLMPATARELGVDPFDPWENLLGGARYLARQLAAFEGDVAAALAAYNAGPGRTRRTSWPTPGWTAELPAETRDYIPRVLSLAGWSLVGETAYPPGQGPETSGPVPAAVASLLAALALVLLMK
jgi:soluble lytic murein transglycosylase-like protein